MTIHVAQNLDVTILPNQEYEFLMPSKEVAIGYGITTSTLRDHTRAHKDELVEGKHFVKGVDISDTLAGSNLQPHQTFWTKRGIVRLGFFIKSERAKQFRDWAEDLVIYATENREALLERINQLEAQLQQKILLPYPVTVAELKVAKRDYYDKHLRPGDLKRLANKYGYNYTVVRAVKCGIKVSPRIDKLLLDLCNENQQNDSLLLRKLQN